MGGTPRLQAPFNLKWHEHLPARALQLRMQLTGKTHAGPSSSGANHVDNASAPIPQQPNIQDFYRALPYPIPVPRSGDALRAEFKTDRLDALCDAALATVQSEVKRDVAAKQEHARAAAFELENAVRAGASEAAIAEKQERLEEARRAVPPELDTKTVMQWQRVLRATSSWVTTEGARRLEQQRAAAIQTRESVHAKIEPGASEYSANAHCACARCSTEEPVVWTIEELEANLRTWRKTTGRLTHDIKQSGLILVRTFLPPCCACWKKSMMSERPAWLSSSCFIIAPPLADRCSLFMCTRTSHTLEAAACATSQCYLTKFCSD
jgi:hypothetical protein